MFRNYLSLAIKNFRKQKMFSLINIVGLTIGITCCLMIFLFVINEFSYDKFHANGKDIYRVMRVGNINGSKTNIPYLSPPYATALLNEYPDAIKSAVRVSPDNDLVTYKNISFNEKKIFLTDSNFFSFFSFHLLKGNPADVLNNPSSIVMTESTAKKYFGNEEPIGKVVQLNKKMLLTVTGIAADVPANSHLDFDMVVPISNWRNEEWFNQWPSNSLFVYVQLNPAVQPALLTSQLPAFMDKYMGKYLKENGVKIGLTINPLKDIYFEGESTFDSVKHGNKKMVYIFMSIAALILIIACINFMNLATAKASDRSKEVGMRKVLGAVKSQLATQFLFESLLFAVLAALIAVGLLQLFLPAYNTFLGYTLPPWYNDIRFYIFITIIIVLVGVLAGSYPALLLPSFSPIESLKGKLKVGKHGAFFRKALVVFQFAISVLLIISITIVMKQMHYVRSTDLGFQKEQSVIVKIDNGSIYNNKALFKNQLEADPVVANVSLMSGEPGGFHDMYSFESEAKPGEKLMMNTEFADFEYVKTLGLKIIAGRDFSASFPTDTSNAVIINQSAAAKMGLTPQQALGKWVKNIVQDSLQRTIVGVVNDFHFTSLKEPIGPLVVSPKLGDRRLALIHLKTADLPASLDRIRKIYAGVASDYPFEYNFLDTKFDQLYKSEIKQETLLTVFSIIAVCIACLGLFGLASYTAVKRTKEIGIRKVVGSSVEKIVLLLSKDLLKPVLAGTLIAIPAGYFIMHKWLQGFAYRVDINWQQFAVASLIAVAIAFITVSYQAVKAAIANPIKSLKSD